MAIDFSTLGKNQVARAPNGEKAVRPVAQFWLNFGYYVAEGTPEERFVSLPMGIPLDTMDKVSTKSSNHEYAMFQAARNSLLDQFVELCKGLEPGEERVIRTESELAIQIRRVSAEQAAPATDASNPYARPNMFSVAA